MESRRRRVSGDVRRRSVTLDLVDAVERHVESIAALILDDRDFDGALADEHLLHAAVDPDTVLEVHHVVAGLEGGETLERAAGGVPPRTPEATLAPKDFVVGEDTVAREPAAGRNDEPTVKHSNRETGRRDAVIVQQLVESLGLADVVAENHGWDPVGNDQLEAFDVALNLLGLAKREDDACRLAGKVQRPIGSESAQRRLGRLEQLVAARRVLAAAA